MIHHISIAANDPLHVAQVLAELWQGQSLPFASYEGSYIALPLDLYGTMIEVHPRGIELAPGIGDEAGRHIHNSHASAYTATHAAISVPVDEARIFEIAAREGWRSARFRRADFFEVIEFWVENQLLIELLPPNLASQYLDFMHPKSLQQILAQAEPAHSS